MIPRINGAGIVAVVAASFAWLVSDTPEFRSRRLYAADATARGGRIPDVEAEPILPPSEAQSWLEVQEAIRDGESLPSRDPAPYYARAEIWSKRLENQEEALLDTLRGVEALLESEQASDPSERDDALRRLCDAAWLSLQRPKVVYPGLAEKHYASGYRAYAAGNFKEAVNQFTRAIQLDGTCPLYLYYRALSTRSLGDGDRAAADAEKGAWIESRLSDAAKMEVSRALRRIQGASRIWLETHRRGRPTYDPRRDDKLSPGLAPESRSEAEQARIRHGMAQEAE